MWPRNELSCNANVSRHGRASIGFSGLFHNQPLAKEYAYVEQRYQTASGVVMSVFKPTAPAIMPSPKNVFEGAMATSTDIVACVPAFIEVRYFILLILIPCIYQFLQSWSRNPEYVAHMKTMKGFVRSSNH